MIPSTLSDIESGSGDEVEAVDGLAMLPNNYIGEKAGNQLFNVKPVNTIKP